MSVPPPAAGRTNAELLRRGAGGDAADTTFAAGFAPTSTFDLDVGDDDAASADAAGRWRAWPWLLAGGLLLLLVLAAARARI